MSYVCMVFCLPRTDHSTLEMCFKTTEACSSSQAQDSTSTTTEAQGSTAQHSTSATTEAQGSTAKDPTYATTGTQYATCTEALSSSFIEARSSTFVSTDLQSSPNIDRCLRNGEISLDDDILTCKELFQPKDFKYPSRKYGSDKQLRSFRSARIEIIFFLWS